MYEMINVGSIRKEGMPQKQAVAVGLAMTGMSKKKKAKKGSSRGY